MQLPPFALAKLSDAVDLPPDESVETFILTSTGRFEFTHLLLLGDCDADYLEDRCKETDWGGSGNYQVVSSSEGTLKLKLFGILGKLPGKKGTFYTCTRSRPLPGEKQCTFKTFVAEVELTRRGEGAHFRMANLAATPSKEEDPPGSVVSAGALPFRNLDF